MSYEREANFHYIQEVRWRRGRERIVLVGGKKDVLWWSGNQECYGRECVVVKEEVHEESKERSVRVMSVAVVNKGNNVA